MQSEGQAQATPEDQAAESGNESIESAPDTVVEPSLKPSTGSDPTFATQNPADQAVTELTETIGTVKKSPSGGTPLFDGSAGTGWAFALAALGFIFGLTLLMMRGRARRQARLHEAEQEDFFQPAGEDATITFDENEIEDDVDAHYDGYEEEAVYEDEEEEEALPNKRAMPFANLFSRKKHHEEESDFYEEEGIEEPDDALEENAIEEGSSISIETQDLDGELATVTINKSEPETTFTETHPDTINFNERRRLEDEARKVEAEARRAEAEARRAAEEERLRSQTALEERERRVRDEERRLAERLEAVTNKRTKTEAPKAVGLFAADSDQTVSANDDGVNSTLIDIEEALLAQSEAMKAETRNLLDSFANRFEERLDTVARAVETREVNQMASLGHGEGGESVATLVDLMSRKLNEHRDAVDNAINKLSTRIDSMATADGSYSTLHGSASEGNNTPLAPLVQLNDILRNALPPNAYELNAVLGNNRKADCLVILPHPPGPIAVDARFPVEAFDEFRRNSGVDKTRAESEFRRAVLRHIVDIAERQIVPDQTADSALMFIPSETMYAELHAHFPDVIQDGYRARVWIVSPTTLMATLHTVRAVLRDAKSRENASLIQNEAREVLGEVEQLRDRVTGLEQNFDRARDDVRGLVSSTNQVYRRAETITRSSTNIDQTLPDTRPHPAITQSLDEPTHDGTVQPIRPSRPTLAAVQASDQNTPPSGEVSGADRSNKTVSNSTTPQNPYASYLERTEGDEDDRPSFPLR